MKLGIVGYRNYTNYEQFCIHINKIPGIAMIISGGCQGADKLAERYALENNIPMIIHKPEWDKYGKSAGPIRNALIVSGSDMIIAFLHKDSKGTKDTIKKAKIANKPFIEVNIG